MPLRLANDAVSQDDVWQTPAYKPNGAHHHHLRLEQNKMLNIQYALLEGCTPSSIAQGLTASTPHFASLFAGACRDGGMCPFPGCDEQMCFNTNGAESGNYELHLHRSQGDHARTLGDLVRAPLGCMPELTSSKSCGIAMIACPDPDCERRGWLRGEG